MSSIQRRHSGRLASKKVPLGHSETEALMKKQKPADLNPDVISQLPTSRSEAFAGLKLPAHQVRAYMAARSTLETLDEFLAEQNAPRASDAYNVDFSVPKCIERLTQGFQLYLYTKSARRTVAVSLTNEALLLDHRPVPFTYMRGLLLGALSSRFTQFQSYKQFGVEGCECFSLLCQLESYDFSSASATAAYDFIIGLSWIISAKSESSCVVPLDKRSLLLFNVRNKLRQMASDRNLTVSELLFMAIIKHLRNTNSPEEEKVRELFGKCQSFARRLYKMSLIMPQKQHKKRQIESQRVALLNSQKLNRIRAKMHKHGAVEKLKRGLSKKQTTTFAYLVPAFKSLFQKNRKDNKGVVEYRRQLTGCSVNLSNYNE